MLCRRPEAKISVGKEGTRKSTHLLNVLIKTRNLVWSFFVLINVCFRFAFQSLDLFFLRAHLRHQDTEPNVEELRRLWVKSYCWYAGEHSKNENRVNTTTKQYRRLAFLNERFWPRKESTPTGRRSENQLNHLRRPTRVYPSIGFLMILTGGAWKCPMQCRRRGLEKWYVEYTCRALRELKGYKSKAFRIVRANLFLLKHVSLGVWISCARSLLVCCRRDLKSPKRRFLSWGEGFSVGSLIFSRELIFPKPRTSNQAMIQA